MIEKCRTLSLACVFAVAGFTIATPSSADVIAQSTFDTDSDGWLVKDLAFPNPGAPPAPLGTFVPTHHGAGGNPGGYLSLVDPTGNTWYWYAPPKFLGNRQNAYGGRLSFDLVVTGNGTPFDEEDVILVGGGLTLVFVLPQPPGPGFTSYHVGLTEVGWRRSSRMGAPATQADMTTVLGALTDLYIRGEYRLAMDDTGQIDNIVLEGSGAICDIQMNKTTFVDGEQVVAQVFRFANTAPAAIPVEFKLWIDVPGIGPISFGRGGADGSVVFPVGFDLNFGPLALFTVPSTLPRGTYAFSCRMLQPVTGAPLTADLNPFEIQ